MADHDTRTLDKQKSDDQQKDGDKDDDQKKDDQKKGDQQPEQEARPARWPWFVGGGILLAFLVVVFYIIFAPTPNVWTNDAYVMVHYANIAPRVSGQVASVDVNDNQAVGAGQVLLTLDPRDYQASVDEARAALARDSAQVGYAAANVTRQPSLILEQQAAVEQAKAQLSLAQSNFLRYSRLVPSGAVTAEQTQNAGTTLRSDQASLQSAEASLAAAQHQLTALKTQRQAAEGTVHSDQAQLAQAELNLSYTRVVSPFGGTVGERSVQVGNYVSAGSTLMTVVPLNRIYITANYPEVALRHVLPGQHVRIHVDAYNIDLNGIVGSLPPASGAIFSPIPPNNATGNFTKIVQRLPVKILVSPHQKLAALLRPGLSVETTIHTGLANVVGAQHNNNTRITSQ